MSDDINERQLYLTNDPQDISRTQDILGQYFIRDEENRFLMESVVGGGMFGLTWKIRHTVPSTDSSSAPTVRHLVLKTDRIYSLIDDDPRNDDGENEEDDGSNVGQSQIPNEKKCLKVLRWCKHIVNDVTPTNDPLARQFPGIGSHHMDMDNWIYLEWLENGTLRAFVDRAVQLGIQLPNRLLWRFFLCLIRMCIAMGWPADKPDEEDPEPVTETAQGRAHGGLIHRDMHDQNIMFGEFIPNDPDMEHTITPILKLIDLGAMRKVEENREALRGAVCDNLFDIGIIMVELVTLSNDTAREISPSKSKAKKFRLGPDTQELLTNGGVILPDGNFNPYPTLDSVLRGLICACLATKPENRPSVSGLANTVTSSIRTRDAQFYGSRNFPGESDDDIRAILDQLIFNPS